MNRWRITNAMLFRRIVNNAKDEYSKGNFKGEHTDRLVKMLVAYGVGMYISYEFGKAGYRRASQIAESMAQTIDGTFALFTKGELKQMIVDNPTLQVMQELLYTIQELAAYINVPGAEKPRGIEFNRGIEETYIAPSIDMEDIFNTQ